jgi:hypothetical protein
MAYALPTWEQRTDGSGSSSSPSLPTPTSRDYKNVGTPEAFERRRLEHPQPLTEIVVNYLPMG